MSVDPPRLARERETVAEMIRLYCCGGGHGRSRSHSRNAHGGRSALCSECAELLEYAQARLERCPFGEAKPTCANCTVHCYRPGMRQRIRAVMRYAGPRMVWHRPLLALWHLLDGRRRPAGDMPRAGRTAGPGRP